MSARVDWLICRRSPSTPEGCIFFTGAVEPVATDKGRLLIPRVSMFRQEAETYTDEKAAHLIAEMLQSQSPALGADEWRALPAAISVPRPYQPQVKSREERLLGAKGLSAEDVADLRTALSRRLPSEER